MNESVSIIIGADIVPTNSNKDLFEKADVSSLLDNKLKEVWFDSDFRIFNLETPLADKETPIEKCGPNLIASTSTVKGIKALNPNLILLANNHIMDQGADGLTSTVDTLSKNDIKYIGVGANLKQIHHSFIFEKNNIKIAIYNCAEMEFSIATNDAPGANPFDPFESLDHIADLKKSNDYVIVCYHGGKEHYRYPSPYLQKAFRKMSDKGADIVIAQHTHCIGCYEEYHGSALIYGQGNFLFDASENECWQTGVLLKLIIGHKSVSVEYVPLVKELNCVCLAPESKHIQILQSLHTRSSLLNDKTFLEKEYSQFGIKMLPLYLSCITPFSLFLKFLCKIGLTKLVLLFFGKKKMLALCNYIECEAHRELFVKGLRNYIEH